MNYNYKTCNEFMDAYLNGTLNEFNENLFSDYINLNFGSSDLFDNNNVKLKYKNGCDCIKDNNVCECYDNVNYWDDKFMWNKIPMFPKNMKYQVYYDKIFPKRKFNKKIFYYLPNGCKTIFITYMDDSLTETFDIKRSITYQFIDDKLILVEDSMDAWFGSMFQNYHVPESEYFTVKKIVTIDYNFFLFSIFFLTSSIIPFLYFLNPFIFATYTFIIAIISLLISSVGVSSSFLFSIFISPFE